MTKHFFPIIEEFLLLFPRFNPTMTTKLPSNVRKDEMKGKKEKQTARNAVAIARDRVLLFVEDRDVRFVTSILQLVDRDEMKGG